MGPIHLERAYYHCKHCGSGVCPADAVLGLAAVEMTSAAMEVVSLAGTLSSFAEASESVLVKLSGLRLAESTVERATESVGEDVGRRLNDGQTFGAPKTWAWHKDAEGKSCAYLSIDATGVPQQGPKAKRAPGKMATVAMVYNPVPDERERWANPGKHRPPEEVRYATTLFGQAGLGEILTRQAAQVGIGDADRVIALSDGGAGLEDWLRSCFPRVDAVILDFFHVSEHLGELAKAWHGVGAEAAEKQHAEWAHQLKREGGKKMLSRLKGLEPPARESVREVWRATVTYFENQAHRMDYPTYVSKGWRIGSGPVESACKTVINQRLKKSGMRWGSAGSDAVAHLRALFLSEPGQWNAYWSKRRSAA